MGPLPERQDIVAISRFAPRIGKGSQEFECASPCCDAVSELIHSPHLTLPPPQGKVQKIRASVAC